MAGDAVHQQPRSALPHPATGRRGGLVAGQSVVETDDAAHGEAAVGHVVRVAGGPLLDDPIEKEGADLEGVIAGGRAGRVAGLGVGDLAGCAENNGVRFTRGCAGWPEKPTIPRVLSSLLLPFLHLKLRRRAPL